ncbi:hypothetical protein PV325_010792 [Microctonus aethiopoides]|nr:hypothetical protein PV325_010792 [Microctonus aethiopoides]
MGVKRFKRIEEILSPLDFSIDVPVVIAVGRVVESTQPITSVDPSTTNKQPNSRTERFTRWKSSFLKRFRDRWSTKNSNRGMKLFSWQKKIKKNVHSVQPSQKQQQQQQEQQQQSIADQSTTATPVPNVCSRFKTACCRSIRWKSKIAPAETTSCCHAERSCGLLCKSRRNWCRWPSCCCSCQREPERSRSIRAKHSLTSVAPPPLSEVQIFEQKPKIPDVLIEHNSVMRGAIPCLPVPLAWFCLIWNVLIPGSGTLWSGLFNLCIGQPRFSATASGKSRFGALIVNIIVGASQFFTVLFCLVGWGWSVWWGVTMIRLAKKWKRFKTAEATNSDPEARGSEGILPAPGVPTHALRGMERAR